MSDEQKPEDQKGKNISRRDLLRSAGLAGAAAAFPGTLWGHTVSEGEYLPRRMNSDGNEFESGTVARRALPQALTVEEREILDAMIARLIPNDEYGPGAREAGALDFIDRELTGWLADDREDYREGLLALDRYAQYSRGARFIELSEQDQDSVLIDVDSGAANGAGAGFPGSSASFFNMVQSHTWQATFGDPHYGGNRDFIGWALIGYPGPRRRVTPEEQEQLEAGQLPLYRRSAYDDAGGR